MKNKKIIFFGGVGSPTTFGGEPSKNKQIISRLRELGCDVTVIDSYKSRFHKLRLLKILIQLFSYFIIYPKATFIISTSTGNIYPILKILHYYPVRLNIIFWSIGGIFSDQLLKNKFNSKYFKRIRLFLVEGKKMKKELEAAGFDNVIYTPNFKNVGVLPKIEKYSDGLTHFLFISRILPDKGCRYILQCAAKLNANGLGDKFNVDFYGNVDPSYKSEFDECIAKMANVNYKGKLQLQDEDNYKVFAKYHYMLFPTYWKGEGFPGVVVDSYKAGVPIIASDWNFNKEFVKDNRTGFIIPTHSVEHLYKVMENAILNKYDNKTLSENCQREVLNYDTKAVINSKLVEHIFKVPQR